MSTNSLMRSVLLAAIAFYRRRLSGRGVLAGVRCTFCGLESCSAYGERIARDAPSALMATARIMRRLARCRRLSLFRLEGGALGWGRGFDAVATATRPLDALANLDRKLARDGERPAVRAAVGRAAALVAVAAEVLAPVELATLPGPLVLVRSAAAARRAWRRRLWTRATVAGIAAAWGVVAGTAGLGMLASAASFAVAACAVASAIAARRMLRRLARLETLARIDGPMSGSMPARSRSTS